MLELTGHSSAAQERERQTASAIITTLKAAGLMLVMLHHFARSVWRGEKRDAPAITQWQYLEKVDSFGVPHSYPGIAGAVLEWLATWGFLGVHLFIVASGIGLGLRYANEAPRWGEFLSRRVIKILLPAWAALVLYFLLEWLLGRSVDPAVLLRKMLMISFFIESEFFAIVTPLWYIATIFQLYLLFPLLLRCGQRWPWATFIVCLAVALVYRHLMQCVNGNCTNQYWGHGGALNWLAVFYAGICVGKLWGRGLLVPLPRYALAVGAAALWGVYAFSQSVPAFYALGDSSFALGALALMLAGGALWHLPGRWSQPLAQHSYGAYLYHRPLFAMLAWRWSRWVGDSPTLILLGGLVACAAMVAVVAGVSRLTTRYRGLRMFFFGQ
ncbi:MAG: acyltransferase [Rubrivivax sp.]|nr:acyltransferase [Rubrivivax sp.]